MESKSGLVLLYWWDVDFFCYEGVEGLDYCVVGIEEEAAELDVRSYIEDRFFRSSETTLLWEFCYVLRRIDFEIFRLDAMLDDELTYRFGHGGS